VIADTPGRRLYENQVRHLLAGDPDGLVEDNYDPDAVVASFDFHVRGHEALKAHFRDYMRSVRIEEIVSTDRFTESDDHVAFEATVRTNRGVVRVYDVITHRDGRIIHHFTGLR
jgi:hypothetical protein